MLIGYHCSHEQHAPDALLANVQAAEAHGFAAAMCSDHLAPFSEVQGQSGFAWTWLGAALATTKLSFGTVTAPGQRYHPVVIAQAAATVAKMFPGRFWWALGTGQFINEHVTGAPWPPKSERRARLLECVDVIRALFRGETIEHHDGRVRVHQAKLYVRPEQPPMLVGAAVGVDAARWVGGWADALITIARPVAELREVVDAFREGGGERKPMFLQSAIAWAPKRADAEAIALEQWRPNLATSPALLTDLERPELLDAAASYTRAEHLEGKVRVSDSLEQHAEWLASDRELGFDRVFVHHVGRDQRGFLDGFARAVLPQFR